MRAKHYIMYSPYIIFKRIDEVVHIRHQCNLPNAHSEDVNYYYAAVYSFFLICKKKFHAVLINVPFLLLNFVLVSLFS